MKVAFPLAAVLIATGLTGAPPAAAQQPQADENIRRVIVYGDDPCPRGGPNEVVVCARRPDNERYRIPEQLREQGQESEESWATRAESIEYLGDTGTMSCSPVGPGGHTGCVEQALRAWREERRRNAQPE